MKQSVAVVLIVVCLFAGVVGGYSVGYVTYEPKIKIYENQINRLTSEVSELKSIVSSYEAQISNLRLSLAEAETKILTLELEKAKLQSDLAQAQSTISNYEEQISALKSQISTLQLQAKGSQAEITALQSQVNYYKTQVSNLQSRLNKILGITVTQHYDWKYQWKTWEWDLPIPLSLYVEYRERPRPYLVASYVDMAKDPKDDYYIDQMVQKINSAAIREGFTELEKVNFVVAFVQSLPYTVDKVTTPYDEYPRYPIETLFDRGGDCEDTSILTAALLDRMGYDVALLWLKEAKHMAVGVSITGVYGSYYEYGGKKYFYLETTGEGWKIGQIPPDITDTRAYIYPLRP